MKVHQWHLTTFVYIVTTFEIFSDMKHGGNHDNYESILYKFCLVC